MDGSNQNTKVRQALMLITALQTALDRLVDMSCKQMLDNGIKEQERIIAKAVLEHSLRLLRNPSQNRYDLATSPLLRLFDTPTKVKIAEVFRDNEIIYLSRFQFQTSEELAAEFKKKGMQYPLAFAHFHAAYLEELGAVGTRDKNRPWLAPKRNEDASLTA